MAEHFVQAAKLCMSPEHCFMAAADLHCTSPSFPQGPDDGYERTWYRVKNNKLNVKCLFWSSTFAALAIRRSKEQQG